MVSLPIQMSREKWAEVLRLVESGEIVRLTRKRKVVATLVPRVRKPRKKPKTLRRSSAAEIAEEDRKWGEVGAKLAALTLEPEDFSDWKK